MAEKEISIVQLSLKEGQYTEYEKARVIGSRALQISQGAKSTLKLTKKALEELNYNPIEIAKKEFEAGKLPLAVTRDQ